MNIGKVKKLGIYVLAEDYAGYNSPFLAQHGISFLIETDSGRLLFDTASYSEPIIFNMRTLGIDLAIDKIVLSHNHFDHTGGLLGLLKYINRKVAIFAHPNIFKVSFATETKFTYVGIPNLREIREEIERLGGTWILSRDPIVLMPGVFTLGEIKEKEKVYFERAATISLHRLEDGRIVRDNVEDEVGLGIATEKGLVVVSGCSHPGIVSMTLKAMKISGYRAYAVVGGFHLIEADEARIGGTIRALRDLGVEKVYTGHCTGLKAESMFLEEYGVGGFEKLHSGMFIDLSRP